MTVWFVRSNGETAHNNPQTNDFVPGEPPNFPNKEFNYRQKCLEEGFARYGWPNTGDIRKQNPTRLAPSGYGFLDIDTRYQTYLEKFTSIKAGDLILIPADQNRGDVHIGIALTQERQKFPPYINLRPSAYYYYHNISNGDWYECAHRVNVLWSKNNNGDYAVANFPATAGIVWILAFAEVHDEDGQIYHFAQKSKLF